MSRDMQDFNSVLWHAGLPGVESKDGRSFEFSLHDAFFNLEKGLDVNIESVVEQFIDDLQKVNLAS